MVASVRDWQLQGVTLKVEVATSGALVIGGTQTDMPFQTGGVGGKPLGWSDTAADPSLYNYTTAQNVFSISTKAIPPTTTYAGIASPSFPVTPGLRYQIGVQAQQMTGKQQSGRYLRTQLSVDGSSWFNYLGSAAIAQTNWEDVLITTDPIGAGYALMRIILEGYSPAPAQAQTLWGTQFQNLYRKELEPAPPPIVWHDITCDVQSIGIRYGREKFTNRYDVSTLSLQLKNDEGQYSFHDPHPLNLQPGRQVRVTATYKGVTYPQAFHVLDSITDSFSLEGRAISRWQCTDPTAILSNTNAASLYTPQLSGGGIRIGILLDQVGYVPRLLDTGTWGMQGVKDTGRTVRDEAGVTADSEGGNFFADRQGNCVYKDRTWINTDPKIKNVQADLVAYPHDGSVMPIVDTVPTDPNAALICVNEYVSDWSLARVINLVQLANAGGTAQTFQDKASQKAYGPQTYQRLDFVLLEDFHLADRANDIMANYTDPVLRVQKVSYAPGLSATWEFTLGVFLNWMVRVWYSHPTEFWGYAFCVHIQSIEHRISPTDWATTFTVDLPASFAELVWGNGAGWDEGIWDETNWDQIGV